MKVNAKNSMTYGFTLSGSTLAHILAEHNDLFSHYGIKVVSQGHLKFFCKITDIEICLFPF